MSPLIECCVRNVDVEVRERLDAIDDTVRVRPCLEHCGRCRDDRFLVVDGEIVTGRACEEYTSVDEGSVE